MSVMYLAGDKGLLEPDMFHNLVDFTRMRVFGRLPDCEELVRSKIITPLCSTFKNDVEQLKLS